MLIAQIIYKFNINQSHYSCFKYFIKNQVWLNVHNFSTAHSTVKLNDWYVSSFSVKHIFKKNFLIIKFKLPAFMKIHSVFHVFLLSHIATDFLPDQQQKPQKPVVTKKNNQIWYINHILNFKFDK